MQIRWAYSLARAETLPVTGELHPLQRELARWMFCGSGATFLFWGGLFLIWVVAGRLSDTALQDREIELGREVELRPPPSIAAPAGGFPVVPVAAAAEVGVPEPVPDFLAVNATIATQAEMDAALTPIDLRDLGGGGGDSVIVRLGGGQGAVPDVFLAIEEPPVRISIQPPVYPEMARAAEVEGEVLVRALVGKDGRVADARILSGHPMLVDAALACARTAVFRPALQQHRPVSVWVSMPISFSLR